jgi:hypothetical protein
MALGNREFCFGAPIGRKIPALVAIAIAAEAGHPIHERIAIMVTPLPGPGGHVVLSVGEEPLASMTEAEWVAAYERCLASELAAEQAEKNTP